MHNSLTLQNNNQKFFLYGMVCALAVMIVAGLAVCLLSETIQFSRPFCLTLYDGQATFTLYGYCTTIFNPTIPQWFFALP